MTSRLQGSLLLVSFMMATSTRAQSVESSPPETKQEVASEADDAMLRVALASGGAALGGVAGFLVGATVAGTIYPVVRRDPPISEALVVAIGAPVALTVLGAAAGGAFAPMAVGESPSVGGGVGGAAGATVGGALAAAPGAYLTWEATKALGDAFEQPSPEGCILSLVGLSAALSIMFGGFCAGAACGGAGGAAGGALLDAPSTNELPPAAQSTDSPTTGSPSALRY